MVLVLRWSPLFSPTGVSTEVFLPQQRDRGHQLLLVQTGGEALSHTQGGGGGGGLAEADAQDGGDV